jgi:hypothetical protein
MPDLAEWDALAHGIADFYTAPDGLRRRSEQMTIGEMANWLKHWRDEGHDLEWIKDRIRESAEWQALHGSDSRPTPAAPIPSPPPPAPPLPTGTPRVLKVTDESDGDLVNRGYSYWSQAVVLNESILVFAGTRDGHPKFWSVNRAGGAVHRLGALLPYTGEAEGWYFDREGWVYLIDGPRLRRVNPSNGEDRIVFSIEESHPGCDLWQAHSSDDGQTHSATVRRIVSDGRYPYVGTVTVRHGRQDFFDARGDLDESQITADGAWLLIKENDDNRIINLDSRVTVTLSDADGAVGHSDCGDACVIGEDNIHGECVLWDFRQPITPGHRQTLLKTWALGHVSVKGGRCLRADATNLSLIATDGSGETILQPHGMVGNDYDHQVMANLDPTGQVAAYLSNVAGRMDLYLLLL